MSFLNFLTCVINNKQKRLSAEFDDIRIPLDFNLDLKIKMPPLQYRPPPAVTLKLSRNDNQLCMVFLLNITTVFCSDYIT